MDDNLDHLQNYRFVQYINQERSEVGYGKIASYIKCSKPTVAYWIQQYRQDKDLTDKQRLGRLRTTTKAQDNQIVKMAKKKHDITSTEIQQKLKKKDVTVSSRTIRRRLVESGERFGSSLGDEKCSVRSSIHKRFTYGVVFRIYERGLIPSACELFGIDSIDWILQEYNDPKHRSKICKKWKEENEATVLPWPSMSPNQNPIENVWQLLKIKISKKKINTTRILKAQLAREWNQLSEYLAKNLVNSMERRVTALIEVGGDFTMY
ncbi:hypothetical protein RclHR1_03950003 [Rhizophagus clarus]|uniref:Tc1-like transposase DDE domain-containing protein n=1 Tax=Rhizophagus clarus TaxID=94130 RepID=A0A2Z6S8E0_9GLOM|nr:hypothetical protein RclHR1_03950003 [Rhizophagus clarus]